MVFKNTVGYTFADQLKKAVSIMALPNINQRQLERNLRNFTIFRLLFSARFYYPVFTILFLDLGLTLEQFSILNVVWALSIVFAEVPSGALADIVGRKNLIIFAAILMVLEMSLLTLATIIDPSSLFLLMVGNRVLSGLSEAAASGADEALAYDSLCLLGREKEWPKVLEKTTQVVSIGFFVSMILGAVLYDSTLINTILDRLGLSWELNDTRIIRMPVVLTLLTSLLLLVNTFSFHEESEPENKRPTPLSNFPVKDAFKQILVAAKWTLNHRFVLFIILAALILDSVARQFVILASEYYRIIDIPINWFGFIGAGMSVIGIANAKFSRYLVENHAPLTNLFVLCLILMMSLIGLCFAIPFYGVIFAAGAFSMIGMVRFQSSYYINREVDSTQRATILSFKGLALNIGLGAASILYSGYVAFLRGTEATQSHVNDDVFIKALFSFPSYFLILLTLFFYLVWRYKIYNLHNLNKLEKAGHSISQ